MTATNKSDADLNKKKLKGRFEVGEDNLPIETLTFEQIEFITKAISPSENSPLNLHFRIMPDASVFKLTRGDARAFKKDGFWYYRKAYDLTCYNSLKYQGYGATFENNNYITGGQLWTISAVYGYEIDEKDALPDTNKTFLYKNRYVYHHTEQPNKLYELKFVRIEGRQPQIETLFQFYFALKESFSHTKTWIDQKLDMEIKCKCGHNGKIEYHVLEGVLKSTSEIDLLTSRLKCNSCGQKGAGTPFPVYSEYTPKHFIHKTAWVPFSEYRSKRQGRSTVRNPELEDMYKNLGGDGENSVYLSDGAYLSPNGKIHED